MSFVSLDVGRNILPPPVGGRVLDEQSPVGQLQGAFTCKATTGSSDGLMLMLAVPSLFTVTQEPVTSQQT